MASSAREPSRAARGVAPLPPSNRPPSTHGAADASGGARPADASRHADWRFLLPCPPVDGFDHLVLLGGPTWLSDVVVELGLARRVSRAVSAEGSADALVLLEDAGVDFDAAAACLRRGGAVYWEIGRQWHSFFRSTPRAIRRRLVDAGLTPHAAYWPRPGFRRAAMFLPIEAPGVPGWYVGTVAQTGGFSRRIARSVTGLFARAFGNSLFALVPRLAVTATVGPVDRGVFATRTSSIALQNSKSTGLLPLILLREWISPGASSLFCFRARPSVLAPSSSSGGVPPETR